MRFLKLIAASLLLVSTGAALAQAPVARTSVAGNPARAALPANVVMNWTGLYGGVHVGAGLSVFKATDQVPFCGCFTAGGGSFQRDGNGVIAGAQIGSQHQFGALVIGIEASGSPAILKKKRTSEFFPATDVVTGTVNSLVTGTLKLGYAMDNFLPYIKLGYAGGNTKFLADSPFFPVTYSQTGWQHGWKLGIGVDYAWTRNLIIGVEYSYLDLGSVTKSGFSNIGFLESYATKVQVHKAAVTLNYLFGR